jgi:hypothetical protein
MVDAADAPKLMIELWIDPWASCAESELYVRNASQKNAPAGFLAAWRGYAVALAPGAARSRATMAATNKCWRKLTSPTRGAMLLNPIGTRSPQGAEAERENLRRLCK